MSEPQDHILSAEKQRAREQAVRFIGIDRRKSSGKVLQKLLRSGYDRSLARDVVRDLIEIDYINDQRAAGKVLERYQGKRIRAKHAMQHIFLRNGISPKAAVRAVSNLSEDECTAYDLLSAVYGSHDVESMNDVRDDMLRLLGGEATHTVSHLELLID